MSDLGRVLGRQPDARRFKYDERFVLPGTLIGVECEFEGVKTGPNPDHRSSNFWSPHVERSLREGGIEYVFHAPLFGEDAYEAIEWLYTEAKKHKFVCSIRTGLHVHLDVRDMTQQQFYNMCVTYAALEPLLFKWVGDSREESVYCVPFYYSDTSTKAMSQVLRCLETDAKSGKKFENGESKTFYASDSFERYAAFNLNALAKFGSVEYRHMKMTTDLERTIDWINMIMSIKKFAMDLQVDAFERLSGFYYANNALRNIFPFQGGRLAAQISAAAGEKASLLWQQGVQVISDIKQQLGPQSWDSSLPKRFMGKPKFLKPPVTNEERVQPAPQLDTIVFNHNAVIGRQFGYAQMDAAEEDYLLPPVRITPADQAVPNDQWQRDREALQRAIREIPPARRPLPRTPRR